MPRRIPPHEDRPRRTTFGRALTDARRAAGLCQSDLAARLSESLGRSINPGSKVSLWEQGRSVPNEEEFAALVMELGTLPAPARDDSGQPTLGW